MDKKTANAVIGGLTQTTKMPCYSYSIPARYCRNGSRLRQDPCSVCHYCYAYERNNYTWPTVKNAQERRYAKVLSILTEPKEWGRNQYIDAFVTLLRDQEFFRWHDSGDLINAQHLELIKDICDATPWCSHRLPTKEFETLELFLARHKLPKNLNVQVSSPYLDVIGDRICDFQMATVYRAASEAYDAEGFLCHATIPNKPSKCGDCRKCWDNLVDIKYIRH